MALIGKIIGGALGSFGGPIGIGIGVIIGHQFDKSINKVSEAQGLAISFEYIIIACMAKMAKADGQVSSKEIAKVNKLFKSLDLEGEELEIAKKIFQNEKDSDTDIGEYLDQFRKIVKGNPDMTQLLYTSLWELAHADGGLTVEESDILKLAEYKLGISSNYKNSFTRSKGLDSSAATEILGVQANASEAEIKKAYRKKCLAMHPDVLRSKGLPDEMMQFAAKQIDSYTKAKDALLNK
jgi:DnaJ like chaperone protein